jgi:predicted MFS family arabinose efflux permease
LGVYNTLQSLGIFAGGAFGGWLAKGGGTPGLFLCCALLMGVWLAVAWAMVVPPPHASPAATPEPAQAA